MERDSIGKIIMPKGIIFDIKEFAVYDGPGIRTTVFFKGCPMRCTWCHNPEGLKHDKELMVSLAKCSNCGACKKVCPNPDNCTVCGSCINSCPMGLRRIAGIEYEAKDLAKKLLKDAEFLKKNGGGYTISGGEPTAQMDFLKELLVLLKGNHRAVETSALCPEDSFFSMLEETDLVLFDLKLIESMEHKRWTTADNRIILENLDTLKKSGKTFIIRIPSIPGVNDNIYKDAADLLDGSKNLLRVELMPYHQTAGAKYPMLGLDYNPGFDSAREPMPDTRPFSNKNIPCVVL